MRLKYQFQSEPWGRLSTDDWHYVVYESKPVEALAPVSEPPRGEALARRLIAPNSTLYFD